MGENMKLKIVKGDITEIKCDAIVCSTNKELIPLGSIDTSIHGAAGPELEKACEKIQRCDVGKCVVTEGYNLPCRYIIHTVSPHISEVSSAHLLAQCYKKQSRKQFVWEFLLLHFHCWGLVTMVFLHKRHWTLH